MTTKRPLFVGQLMTDDYDVVYFLAARSTADLVEGSPSRFCGVVTGTHSYSNVSGGQTRAVELIGVFDLPENRGRTDEIDSTPAVEYRSAPKSSARYCYKFVSRGVDGAPLEWGECFTSENKCKKGEAKQLASFSTSAILEYSPSNDCHNESSNVWCATPVTGRGDEGHCFPSRETCNSFIRDYDETPYYNACALVHFDD